MRLRAVSWALCGLLSVGGCGRQTGSAPHESAPTTPATALTPATPPAPLQATPEQKKLAGLEPSSPTTVTRPNEDGSETVEETSGDNGARNSLLAAVASTVAAATPAAAAASPASSPWTEGTNYTRIVPAQPTAVANGQVEVLEFFWYACPHCYALDPLVETWRKSKPAYVTFSRVPVMWSDGHRATARLFYTLETLGKLDQLHSDVFKEIHVTGNTLVAADPSDAAGSERLQTAFAHKFGIGEDEFKKAYHSFGVDTDLQRADQLVQRYRIEGVPTFVINGKYVADVRSAGSPEKLISLVSDLAAKEHKN